MNRLQKSSLLLLVLVCAGMCMAETLEQTLARHEQMIYSLAGAFDSQHEVGKKLNRDIVDLYGWNSFFLLFCVALLIWQIVQSVKAGNNRDDIRRTSLLVASNIELCGKIELLEQQNKDLINRHEELIKLLLAKMGTQAPTQNVVIQQPKSLPKPTREIVEINPNSPADQSWLASQVKKHKPQ